MGSLYRWFTWLAFIALGGFGAMCFLPQLAWVYCWLFAVAFWGALGWSLVRWLARRFKH